MDFNQTSIDEQKVEDFEVEEELVFDLTDEEILALAKQTANFSRIKREKEGELKRINEDKKDEIKGIESDIRYNNTLIEHGKIPRTVHCIMRKNYTRKIVQWLFNGSVMKERALSDSEIPKPQDNTVSSINQ